MGMGRRGPESVRAADTLRTPCGHFADTFRAFRRCLRGADVVGRFLEPLTTPRQPLNARNDLREERSISPPSTAASSEIQRTKPLATDQAKDISIAVRQAQTVPGRSTPIRTPLDPSIQPRPTQPTIHARRADTPQERGQAHRLRTLVEGAESGRADPRIPHGNAAGRARTHPIGGWVFRMGFGWVGQRAQPRAGAPLPLKIGSNASSETLPARSVLLACARKHSTATGRPLLPGIESGYEAGSLAHA